MTLTVAAKDSLSQIGDRASALYFMQVEDQEDSIDEELVRRHIANCELARCTLAALSMYVIQSVTLATFARELLRTLQVRLCFPLCAPRAPDVLAYAISSEPASS